MFCFVLFCFVLLYVYIFRVGLFFCFVFVFVSCRQKGKYADLLMEEESGLARLMKAFAEGGSDNDDGNEVRVCPTVLCRWFVCDVSVGVGVGRCASLVTPCDE